MIQLLAPYAGAFVDLPIAILIFCTKLVIGIIIIGACRNFLSWAWSRLSLKLRASDGNISHGTTSNFDRFNRRRNGEEDCSPDNDTSEINCVSSEKSLFQSRRDLPEDSKNEFKVQAAAQGKNGSLSGNPKSTKRQIYGGILPKTHRLRSVESLGGHSELPEESEPVNDDIQGRDISFNRAAAMMSNEFANTQGLINEKKWAFGKCVLVSIFYLAIAFISLSLAAIHFTAVVCLSCDEEQDAGAVERGQCLAISDVCISNAYTDTAKIKLVSKFCEMLWSINLIPRYACSTRLLFKHLKARLGSIGDKLSPVTDSKTMWVWITNEYSNEEMLIIRIYTLCRDYILGISRYIAESQRLWWQNEKLMSFEGGAQDHGDLTFYSQNLFATISRMINIIGTIFIGATVCYFVMTVVKYVKHRLNRSAGDFQGDHAVPPSFQSTTERLSEKGHNLFGLETIQHSDESIENTNKRTPTTGWQTKSQAEQYSIYKGDFSAVRLYEEKIRLANMEKSFIHVREIVGSGLEKDERSHYLETLGKSLNNVLIALNQKRKICLHA